MARRLLFLLVWTVIFLNGALYAQGNQPEYQSTDTLQTIPIAWVVIQEIELIGNKQTRPQIINRELTIHVGDTLLLVSADSLLERNRNNVFNTNLFVSVSIDLVHTAPREANLKIYLAERWYIFPGPIFELSDRNFNEWIRVYNADLNRTNYGMRVVLENFRGRKEKLDAFAQFGFTQKFGLSYEVPYLNKKQVLGMSLNLIYTQNKSVAFRSADHILQFYESEQIAFERYFASLALNRRIGIYDYHTLTAGFQAQFVEDSLAILNPRFFLNGKTSQRFFFLSYRYAHDTRDMRNYPLHGDILEASITQNGLGVFGDLFQTQARLSYIFYTDLRQKFYLANGFRASLSVQKEQPYINARGLGFGREVMRGFELYVIEGQGFMINQNTLRYQLFDVKKKFKLIPIQQFQTIPLSMYLTSFVDMGYVCDTNFRDFSNRFTNRLIYSWGAGVDFVTFYNFIIRLNYAMNSAKEGAFFFRVSTSL